MDKPLIACRKCGYNLRGLLVDSVCPECGTAVGRTTYGDLLRFCDPAWVRTLASGMNWSSAGIICLIASKVLAGPLIAAIMITMRLSATYIVALSFGLSLAVELVGLIGCWKVTTPDPVRVEAEASITARSLARIAWVSSFVLGIIVAGWVLALLVGGQAAGVSGQVTALIGVVQEIIKIIGTIAICIYARRLAMRIPDERLAISTRALMWLFIIINICFVVGIPLAGVGFPVIGIAMLILIVRYGRALSRAAGSGRSGIP